MNKFDEVIIDIIEKIESLKYDDIDKNVIKTNVMLNLFFLCKNEKTFEENVYTLKKAYENKNNKSI